MAALDRRNPNLDDFVGLNWSCWVDSVNIFPSDARCNDEDSSKNERNHSETMTLRKEDMHIFGHCPAHDELYLVVCSHCGQVVKPQAFDKHCERRHGALTKTCGKSSTSASQQRARPARPSSNHSSSREIQKDARCHEVNASSSSSSSSAAAAAAASPTHQHRLSKAQKEAVSVPSVEKFPQETTALTRQSPTSSSTPRPRVPPWHSGPLPPGHCSSSNTQSVQKPSAEPSGDSHSPLRGTRTYSRINKNMNKKECDLNKQSGVLDPEKKKLVSWELVCNTDSIQQQQQKSLGKTKTFDQLMEEEKTTSAGRVMEQLLVKSKRKEQHLDASDEKNTTQSLKTFNSNSHFLSGSRDPLHSEPEEEGDSAMEDSQPHYPLNQSLVSGDESDADEQEEATDLPATPWHPKPLGLCTFGCRTLGCSIFTFNRRLHHLRFALSAMLEHHVNTHLWKKMPQVSSGLRSCHITPPTVGSLVRTGDRPSKSPGSLRVESTSRGQKESKTSLHNSHSITPPSSTTSVRLRPGGRRSPVGRTRKARLKEEKFMQDASAAQKAAHGVEDKSTKYLRDPPLNEKGQPHVPISQGPVNGALSHGKKPCPPPQHSPRSKGKSPGIQQKPGGYDHSGLAQKRKGSNETLPLGSSQSRTKNQRLSSSAQRGERMERLSGTRMLWAWRKDQE